MANRRRSERYQVAIPVVITGGRAREKTLSADVSAHGLAVFSEKGFTSGDRVRLELQLPPGGTPIRASGQVARTTERLADRAGLMHPGVAFDFAVFEDDGQKLWQRFLAEHGSPRPAEEPVEDLGATFLINPDDIGRLWAFFRGELAEGRVRIESDVVKPAGTPVELLVIHPSSNAEWSIYGTVSKLDERGRGRGPMIEIALEVQDEQGRENFRRFLQTGQIQAPAPPAAPFEDEDTENRATVAAPPAPERATERPPPLPSRAPARAPTFAAFFSEFEHSQASDRPARFDDEDTD